jgi:hypothetical protein
MQKEFYAAGTVCGAQAYVWVKKFQGGKMLNMTHDFAFKQLKISF